MKLEVNGEILDVGSAEDTPLLWVLRDYLNMTGTKFGCGKGLCGACMVHVDGQPVGLPTGGPLERAERGQQCLVGPRGDPELEGSSEDVRGEVLAEHLQDGTGTARTGR